eukprot:TRINITY_DN33341_c0_g1_i1.p2 TRINITY_DN33341_c0_g1~~TRINITY_DN33341_c0_g1_i1.p2  ORF type:complete len:369 (+),score=115.60 TRINITY_DN33341_c0_g1_i1:187-1293(+)
MEVWLVAVIALFTTAVVTGMFIVVVFCLRKRRDAEILEERRKARRITANPASRQPLISPADLQRVAPHFAKADPPVPPSDPGVPRTPPPEEEDDSVITDPNDPLQNLPLSFDLTPATRRGVPASGYLDQYTDPDAIVQRRDGQLTTRRINQMHDKEARPDLLGGLVSTDGGGATVSEMRFDFDNVDPHQDPHSGVASNLAGMGGPAPPRRYVKRVSVLPALYANLDEVPEQAVVGPVMPNGLRTTKELQTVSRGRGTAASMTTVLNPHRGTIASLPLNKEDLTPLPSAAELADTSNPWTRPRATIGRPVHPFNVVTQNIEKDHDDDTSKLELAILQAQEMADMAQYPGDAFLPELPGETLHHVGELHV